MLTRHFVRCQMRWILVAAIAIAAVPGLLEPLALAQSYSLSPSSLVWTYGIAGTPGQIRPVAVINTGTTSFTIQSFSITSSQFWLIDGYAPHVVYPGTSALFNLRYMPTTTGTVNANLVLNLQGYPNPILVPLSGSATTTRAIATVTANSLSFPDVSQGSFSPIQQWTITNTGKTGMSVQGVSADVPFKVTGYNGGRVTLQPNTSLTLQVSMFGVAPGPVLGEMTIALDVLPGITVNLSGNVNPASGLVISSLPSLPLGTVGAPYQSTVVATGGTPPYSFSLAASSTLPSGLLLSPDGTIFGTLSSALAAKTYPFTVQVTDSSAPANTVSLPMSLQILPQTGSNCNDTAFDVPSTTDPLVPLTDLGSGTYLGQQGGLYANGSNVRPAGHDAAGVLLAQSIQPLDAAGNPDPSGKMGLMTLGMSETRLESMQFVTEAIADPSLNPHLVVFNGAIDQIVAARWANPNDGVWNSIFNFFLPQAGLTANQVVAAWIKDADNFKSSSFPTNTQPSQADLESIARNLHTFFPNLKLAYFSSRIYGGYANGRLSNVNFEPYAYETGWAVKNAIADQINGKANLNYDPNLGPVYAPWTAWGPYDWANGLLARSDGLVWTCQDIQNDGIHPSVPYGVQKDANLLMNFFKTDTTTTPWFLAQ